MLSRAKCRERLQLLNFEPEYIKVNKAALSEMNRMRKEQVFAWKHPLHEMLGIKLTLLNSLAASRGSRAPRDEHFLNSRFVILRVSIFGFLMFPRKNCGHLGFTVCIAGVGIQIKSQYIKE